MCVCVRVCVYVKVRTKPKVKMRIGMTMEATMEMRMQRKIKMNLKMKLKAQPKIMMNMIGFFPFLFGSVLSRFICFLFALAILFARAFELRCRYVEPWM